jgi:tetratricopeptide (TPR) repeat protein
MTVLLVLALLLQQAPPKKPVALPGQYAHPFHAYKLLLPAGWSRGTTHSRAQASFYAPKIEAYTPRVDLYIHKGVKEIGPFATKFRDSFRTALTEVTFPVDELTSVRGRTAIFLQVKFTDGEVGMKSLWIIVHRDDRIYQLGWACTAAFFDRFAPAVEAMFKSLRIYPEPEIPKEKAEKFLKLYNAAELLYRDQKYAEAADQFREAAELLPEYPEIHASIGTSLMRLKDYAGAESAYRKAQELDPDDASHAYNFGNALLQQRKLPAAAAALSRAAQAEPWNEPAWTNLGVARLLQKEYEPAARALEQAIVADPESAAAHYNLGIAYEELGEKSKAAAQYRETLKLDRMHEGAAAGLKRTR